MRIIRRLSFKCVILLVLTCIIFYFFLRSNIATNAYINVKSMSSATNRVQWIATSTGKPEDSSKVVLGFVVCDSRYNESLNVVKSALLFTRLPIHLVIFTDDTLLPKFNETLTGWRSITNNQLAFELHKINFPEANKDDWLHLFSKCAAQRLFIPSLLPHIDAMLYVDTDTLLLGPVEELWEHLGRFNSSQISGMALEDDNPNVSWYPRFAKHPFYGKYGVNSGVMLMNLTRMREFGWVDYVTPIMLKWKLYIPWGDQDIINIIFHYHARAVYVLPCRYNYRADQCMYGDACAAAASRGVFLLHGSRRAFHNDKQPAFQAMYRAVEEYEVGSVPARSVLGAMQRYLAESPASACGHLRDAFLRVPEETLRSLYSTPHRRYPKSGTMIREPGSDDGIPEKSMGTLENRSGD